MRKTIVLNYFDGSQAAVARFLGISRQAVYDWRDVIPENSARRLADMTGGELTFDESLYRKSAA